MPKAFRVIRELLEDLQHFMEDWRKQLPGMYKQVTDIKMVQELYDDVEFMEYTADLVDGILNQNTASEQSASSEQTTAAGEQENSTTAESGVINYSLGDKLIEEVENYPYDMRNVINGYISSVDEDLMNFYNDSVAGTSKAKVYTICKTTQQIIDEIKEELGIDTKGWHIRLASRMAQHISFDHGVDGKTDKSMANSEDVARMKFILDNHDWFGAQSYSSAYKEFRNGKTRNARTITFALKIDGTFYLVVAVPEASKKTIWINTAFISKKIEANQFRNASNRPLRYTPKNETDSASNNSISNNTEKSNSNFQVSNADYLEAARNGDEEKAAEYVEQAAKEWGAFSDGKPAPINLYHGTKSFGFTEFDLQKMDDKGRKKALTSN